MKKNIIAIVLLVSLFMSLLAGCGTAPAANKDSGGSKKVSADQGSADASQEKEISTDLKVSLYFPDDQAAKLVKEERTIQIKKASGDITTEEMAKAAIQELVKGPKGSGLFSCIPTATRVLSVTKKDDTLIVDLSKEFKDNNPGGSTGSTMSIAPIVLALTDLEGIRQVSFRIDGKDSVEFDNYILDEPFTRDEFQQLL